jgi:hypothetical protein
MCAIAAAVLGLANVVTPWLAALLVAGALFLVAGMLALTGRRNVKKGAPPVPKDAVESAKTDVAIVREAVKR